MLAVTLSACASWLEDRRWTESSSHLMPDQLCRYDVQPDPCEPADSSSPTNTNITALQTDRKCAWTNHPSTPRRYHKDGTSQSSNVCGCLLHEIWPAWLRRVCHTSWTCTLGSQREVCREVSVRWTHLERWQPACSSPPGSAAAWCEWQEVEPAARCRSAGRWTAAARF